MNTYSIRAEKKELLEEILTEDLIVVYQAKYIPLVYVQTTAELQALQKQHPSYKIAEVKTYTL